MLLILTCKCSTISCKVYFYNCIVTLLEQKDASSSIDFYTNEAPLQPLQSLSHKVAPEVVIMLLRLTINVSLNINIHITGIAQICRRTGG